MICVSTLAPGPGSAEKGSQPSHTVKIEMRTNDDTNSGIEEAERPTTEITRSVGLP